MKDLTVKKFLKNNGIKLTATKLLSFIDGYMRTPDLEKLMEDYAELKIKEYKLKTIIPSMYENNA